jgi:hypothetical protein
MDRHGFELKYRRYFARLNRQSGKSAAPLEEGRLPPGRPGQAIAALGGEALRGLDAQDPSPEPNSRGKSKA